MQALTPQDVRRNCSRGSMPCPCSCIAAGPDLAHWSTTSFPGLNTMFQSFAVIYLRRGRMRIRDGIHRSACAAKLLLNRLPYEAISVFTFGDRLKRTGKIHTSYAFPLHKMPNVPDEVLKHPQVVLSLTSTNVHHSGYGIQAVYINHSHHQRTPEQQHVGCETPQRAPECATPHGSYSLQVLSGVPGLVLSVSASTNYPTQ